MYLRVRDCCAALLMCLVFAESALGQDATPTPPRPPQTGTSQTSPSSGGVPLPSLKVETTANKAAKKSAPRQAPAPAKAPPVISSKTEPESAVKSPPNSFVAKTSSAATKTDTPLLETPQSVSVVTRQQMDTRGVTTMTEALQYVPGVYTESGGADPRFDQYKLRGFAAQGNAAFRDGLKELGNSDTFAHFRTETYGLERVDVIRGPSSVLYGQIAPGGLVNAITKRPTRETIREVVGTVGSNDLFQGAFDFSGALDPSGQFMARLTGVRRDSDAQIDHFGNLIPDDRVFIAPSFTWRPDANTTFTVLADYQRDETGNAFTVPVAKKEGNVLQGKTLDVYPLPLWTGDPDFNRFDQEQFRVGYQFEHRFNEMFTVRQGLRYGEVDLDYRYLLPFMGIPLIEGGTPILNRDARDIDEATKSFTVDNQVETRVSTGAIKHTFITGLDYQRFQLDSTTFGGPGPILDTKNPIYGQPVSLPTTLLQRADQEASQLGVYAQDQAKLDNWILTIGGRYDWANLDSTTLNINPLTKVPTTSVARPEDEAFTGRAGLIYVFDFGLAPYVSYSESFLPTMGVDKGGNPFAPTTGEQYEAGIKYEPPGTRSRFTFAAFDITQQNVLTADPTDLRQKVQTGEIQSRGIEAEATIGLSEALQLIATYTLMDVEVTKATPSQGDLGKVPILTPTEMASIFADYTFQHGPLAGFGFGAGVRYIAETYMDPQNTLTNDAYTVVDAALHYTYKDTTWALNVNNVFNREETVCTTAGGCQYISPQVVRASVRHRW